MTVYKRAAKEGIAYFTTEPSEAEVAPDFDSLSEAANASADLTRITNQSKAARVRLALALLNEDIAEVDLLAHIQQVREAAGATWTSLRSWCEGRSGRAYRTDDGPLVPLAVLEVIRKQEDEHRKAARMKRSQEAK